MMPLNARIRGVEHEIAINTIPPSYDLNYHHRLIDFAVNGLSKRGYVLKTDAKSSAPNGGIVYDDLAHLEICTPSYTDPESAVIYDKVTEIYALGGAQAAAEAEGERVIVHKTNYSTFPSNLLEKAGILPTELTSYATHGNIVVSRESFNDWNAVMKAMIPNNIARIVLTGAGDVMPRVGFVISPRAMFTSKETSFNTTADRGIINERCWKQELSRNYADPAKYMRWHDIHFEGLRCDWNIWIRDVWQTLVVSAFEAGFLKDPPRIRKPVDAFKKLSQDWNGDWKVTAANGQQMDVVDDILIGYFWDRILRFLGCRGLDKEEKIWAGQIEFLLKKLSTRSLEYFENCGIDWITKIDWLKEYGLLTPKSHSEMDEARRVCRAFAWIDPTVLHYVGTEIDWDSYECLFDPRESVKFIKETISWIKWDDLSKKVMYSLNHAPETTRDFFAAEVLKKYSNDVLSRSWDEISAKPGRIKLSEPIMLNRSESEDIILKSETIEDVWKEVKAIYPDNVVSQLQS